MSASRLQTSQLSANRTVQVITQDEIETAPVNSVSELLDFVQGLDAMQRGMFGTQTDLSIRGGTFEQVLVLVNGTRLSDPQTGHHLMNLPVQKSDIERIEVLLGGGSYIFGGSAFSGVVNIITKKEQRNFTSVDVAAGSFESFRAGLTENISGESHSTRLSFNHNRSAGFKPNTDFSNTNLIAQSNIDLKEHKLVLNGGYTWQNFGAQNFYSDAFPNQYEKTRTLFLSAGMESGQKVKLKREIYWRRHWDEFQLFREGEDFYVYENGLFINNNDTAPSFYQGHNYHRSDVLGAKVDVSFNGKWGRTSVGTEYRYEAVVSNILGEPLEDAINIAGSRGKYTVGASRHNVDFAIEHSKKLGQFDLSIALQANYNTSYETGFYPGFTAGYRLTERQKVYASFNRSFRLPSYTDLYYNRGGAVGSIFLQPENSLNYELGYKWQGEKTFANVSIFRREGKDIIDWVQRCDTCLIRATNTASINFNGADFSFTIKPKDWLKDLNFQQVNFGYSYLFTDEGQGDYQSFYAFDYLQHKINIRLRQQFWKKLNLNYMASFQQRNGTFVEAESGDEKAFSAVILINVRAAWQFEHAVVYVSAQNLLDQRYFDRGNIELPGLWLWAGLEFKF